MTKSINIVNTNTTDGGNIQQFTLKGKNNYTLKIIQDSKIVWDIDTNRDKPISNRNGSQTSVNLRPRRYDAFRSLVNLDGNGKDLSEKDIKKAITLKGKYGIKNVVTQEKGILLLMFDDNTEMLFNYETDAEIEQQKNNKDKVTVENDQQEKKPTYGDYVDKLGVVHGTMHYICDKMGIPM